MQKVLKYFPFFLSCITSCYALEGTTPQVNDEARTVIAMLATKYIVNDPASLLYHQPLVNHCGGTVINNRYLITALHCLDKQDFDKASTTNSPYTINLTKIDTMLPTQRHYGSSASQFFSNGCFAIGQAMFDEIDSGIDPSIGIKESFQECPFDNSGNSQTPGFKPNNNVVFRVKDVKAIYVHKRQGSWFFPDIAVLDLGPSAIPAAKQSSTNVQIPDDNGLLPLIRQSGADIYGFSMGENLQTHRSTTGDLHTLKLNTSSIYKLPNLGLIEVQNILVAGGDSGSPALTKVTANGSTIYYLTGLLSTGDDNNRDAELTNVEYYSDWITKIFDNQIDSSNTITCYQGVSCNIR